MNLPSAHLHAVCTANTAGAAMHMQNHIQAIAGCGLSGDRYERGTSKFSGRFEVATGARELSLIDVAAVTECNARLDSRLSACDLRRNLVISGLDLDALHGAVLAIGEVRLRVIGACPPCGYLSRQLGVDAVRGLRRLGGARAAILESGILTVGTLVEIITAAPRHD